MVSRDSLRNFEFSHIQRARLLLDMYWFSGFFGSISVVLVCVCLFSFLVSQCICGHGQGAIYASRVMQIVRFVVFLDVAFRRLPSLRHLLFALFDLDR